MDTILLAGKPVAQSVYDGLATRIAALRENDHVPGLAVVLVGDDPASKIYVGAKARSFKKLGLLAETLLRPASITEEELLTLVDELNADPQYHGILVQMPLPKHIDPDKVIDHIDPSKDVDGFHPYNVGRLLKGKPTLVSCTPQGVIAILEYYDIPTAGRHAVIIGRSNIVGKPMMSLLMQKWERGNATVTVCHTGTGDMGYFTSQADILVVAAGAPEFITADMVKSGVDIIDVGMNRVPDDSEKGYRLCGDVKTADMMGLAHSITPVPGGVGLMTVAMLVKNTVLACEIITGGASGP